MLELIFGDMSDMKASISIFVERQGEGDKYGVAGKSLMHTYGVLGRSLRHTHIRGG